MVGRYGGRTVDFGLASLRIPVAAAKLCTICSRWAACKLLLFMRRATDIGR
jgi:hypothetical protein